MEKEPFVIERLLNASLQRVWQALTDKDKMKKWYFDLKEFKAEEGIEFEFEGGPPETCYLHKCKVLEAEENKKLSYSWRYEGYAGNSIVSWELIPEGDKTRLKLTHSGLETFPKEIADFARENYVEGWTHFMGAIQGYLESNT